MRLLIIASDSSGSVTLASPQVFADATEAARELTRLLGDGVVDTSASFHVVDVDAAAPVIVVQQPVAVPAVPEAVEPVEEPFAAEVIEDAADEPEPVETPEEPEAAETPEAPEAAEPVEAPAEPEAVETPEAPAGPERDVVVEPAPDEPASPVEAPAVEQAPQEADLAAGAQWPWDLPVIPEEGTADDVAVVAEAVAPEMDDPEVPVDTPHEVQLDAEEDRAIEESADFTLEPAETVPAEQGVVAETSAAPEPEVALADLGVVLAAPADEALPEVPVVAEEASSDDSLASLIAAIATSDASTPVPAEASSAVAAPVVLVVAEPQSVLDAPAPSEAAESDGGTAYEPGALNLSEYTCDDCVYVNTCPNRDQKKPAECGSFQWKA